MSQLETANKKKGAATLVAPSSTPTTPAQKTTLAPTTPVLAAPTISDADRAIIREEEKAKLEKEMKEKFMADKEAELASKAGQGNKTASKDSDIADAVNASHEEMISKGHTVVDRIIKIQPKDLAKGEARVGQLLPGSKRSYQVYKNRFGQWITGFTDDELKAFKSLPVWDHVRNEPNADFWNKYKLTLTTAPRDLHIDKSEEHLIDYRVAMGHREVANSASEVNSITLFFIVDDEREAKNANIHLDHITKAYTYIGKMAPSERRAFLSLFGVGTINSSDEVVTMNLSEKAQEGPQKFVSMYEDDNKTDKIVINEMVEHNVLQRREGAIWFNDALIGPDFAATVVWMAQPKNQDIKLKLMQQLEIAKRL